MAPLSSEGCVVQHAPVDEVDQRVASRLVVDLHKAVGEGAVHTQPALVGAGVEGEDPRELPQDLHERCRTARRIVGEQRRQARDAQAVGAWYVAHHDSHKGDVRGGPWRRRARGALS